MNTDSNNLSEPVNVRDTDGTDTLTLLLAILRGWKTIVFLALLGLIIGILYSRYEDPTFKADALIQIEAQSQGISSALDSSDLVSSNSGVAQTEAELIKSRMVLKPVVDLLHLGINLSDPTVDDLDRIQTNRTTTQINTSAGVSLATVDGLAQVEQFNVSQEYLNQTFTLVRSNTGFVLSNGSDDFKGQLNQAHRFRGSEGIIEITVTDLPDDNHPINITKQSLQNTTDSIKSSLSVTELGDKTGIIQLSLIGQNQQQITLTLKQIVLSYIAQNQSRGSEETTKTIKFMETQLPLLKENLEDSEAVFNEFREESGTINIDQEAGILVAENSRIDTQLSELQLKKADLTTYYTEEHPLVVQINDQIAVLNNRQQEIESRVESLPEVQREFLKLSEDTSINREIYLTMLKNYQQLKIVKAGQIGYARIIDMPISTYRTIAPQKQLIIMLATLLGALLGIMLVLLRNMLRNTVKDPDRLEVKTGVPVIATIPRSLTLSRLAKNKEAPNRLLAYVDHNSVSYEAVKSLRTHLMFGMPEEGKAGQRAKVILISGESPGVGKSFIAANLAEVLGQLNKKILVIDADMRLGELHKSFNIDHHNGLADYFSKENDMRDSSDLSNIVHPTAMEHIDFIPRGQQPYNPTSLLASEQFKTLMNQLNEHYDYIIIDSPPILAASDAIILAQYADKVLMVTRHDNSVEGQVVHAIRQLGKANVQVDGIILNDVKQGVMSKYNYNYSYAYGNTKKAMRD